MAGLKGQSRVINPDPRIRRNAANLSTNSPFASSSEPVGVNDAGVLVLNLGTNSGLSKTGGALVIDLDSTPALQLAAGGLSVLLDPSEPGLQRTSGLKVLLASDGGLELSSGLKVKLDASEPGLQLTSGLKVLLASDPGLEFSTGVRVKVKTDGGIVRDADGLSVTAATAAVAGAVKQLAAITDLGQTITDPPTQAEVQAISDKVDEILAAMRTAGSLAV